MLNKSISILKRFQSNQLAFFLVKSYKHITGGTEVTIKTAIDSLVGCFTKCVIAAGTENGDDICRKYRITKCNSLVAVVPVCSSFWDVPHLDPFEGPSGGDCHINVAVPVGVAALGGSWAFGANSAAGMKNPFFSCI